MKIKIITVGKPKGEYEKIFNEYLKRLSGFVKVEIFHIKENGKAEENILKNSSNHFLILLDEKGEIFSSRELATFLEKKENQSISNLVFVIGGANGHSDNLKSKSDFLLSFSKLTFPHDMAMIILAETLYRSFSILKNHPYHRD